MDMRHILFAASLLAAVALGHGVAAQDYQPWSDPAAAAADEAKMQELVDKLRTLVDKADQARAADPNFIRDLRALADSYDDPWRKSVLLDEFRDGNTTANPAWSVISGTFSVDPTYGLRTTVTAPVASSGSSSATSSQEIGLALLQAFLGQATQSNTSSSSGKPKSAVIAIGAGTPNAFRITLEFGSLVSGGRFAYGVYPASDTSGGYRVVYVSGAQPAIRLVALKKGEQSVIATKALTAPLEDKKRHIIAWTREATGAMSLTLDGTEIIKATDTVFRDRFSGFTMMNLGGDFVVRRVAIDAKS